MGTPMRSPNGFSYFAKPIRVVDGDTIEVELDLGLRLYHRCFIRLAYIDCPEKNRKVQREAGSRVTSIVDSIFCLNTKEPYQKHLYGGRIYVDAVDFDKYANRIIGMAYFPGVRSSLNSWLIKNGLAKVYGQGTWTAKRLQTVVDNAVMAQDQILNASPHRTRGVLKAWNITGTTPIAEPPQEMRAQEFGVS